MRRAAVAVLLLLAVAVPACLAQRQQQDEAGQQQKDGQPQKKKDQPQPKATRSEHDKLQARLAKAGVSQINCSTADLPQIRHSGTWRSTRPRTKAAKLTIVTQLTMSRTRRLTALCHDWDGIIAAGVYMSVVASNSSADVGSGSGRSADAEADGSTDSSADVGTGGSTDGAAALHGSSATADAGSAAAVSKSSVADDDYGQGEGEGALAGGGATATVARRLHASGDLEGSSMAAGRQRTAGSSGSGAHLRGSTRSSGSRLVTAARWLLGDGGNRGNDAADSAADSTGPASDTSGGAGRKWRPEPTTIAEALQRLSEVHVEAEKNGNCWLDMALYTEDYREGEDPPVYPINAVRNRALDMVETKDVMLLDVDFLVGGGTAAGIAKYPGVQAALKTGAAVVLPAFEPMELPEFDAEQMPGRMLPPQDVVPWGVANSAEGAVVQSEAIAGNKRDVVWMWRAGQLDIFHSYCRQCHAASDYETWAAVSTLYNIRYENSYEPYVIMRRDMTPPYDERFRGYYSNKALQLRHLYKMGRTFLVHPAAWVVHSPHPRSAAFKAVESRNMVHEINQLDKEVKFAMKDGSYTPHSIWTCKGSGRDDWTGRSKPAATAPARQEETR